MFLHAITDRRLFSGDENTRCAALLAKVSEWAPCVSVIHVREKDLPEEHYEALIKEVVRVVSSRAVVLVSERAELARRAGADGVHLASAATASASVSARMRAAAEAWGDTPFHTSISCHTAEDAQEAWESGASEVVFAPVFEKLLPEARLPGAGLEALRTACKAAGSTPVVALGGVTAANAAACIATGAAGIAGIRLFAGEEWRLLAPAR